MEETVSKLGERLKRVRLEQGLTLRDLGLRAQVSAGTIQKIEAGRLVPSVEIFVKVTKALRRRASFFLGDEDGAADVRVIRREARKSFDAGARIKIESIAETLREPKMEGYLITVPKRARSGRPLGFSGEILFFCNKGSVDFFVRGKKEVLRQGDSIHFKAAIPHRFQNNGPIVAELLVVWSPA
ncbi:MAG: XRE family transcriptional regulator [Candidatus Binatus sp.]|uniref:helix-turn-helix domain-containing protein n=1 Tax=Candidatus Binatus sp. TaxID=2811406 RepID=UPI00271AF66A|nr:XRE family transcriptional regulator [Candidatus Binatus sp.]MDO8431159.1 XRE family transcriptional regulator [Candidatus Binatus sp.]